MPAALAAALGIALAEALAAIHQAGVLHRDLKPGNIILGRDGPRVIDFGLAALTDRPGHLTFTNDVLGTPACMSPEQAISSRDVTAATDVYALGATLTYALAGHYPYEGETGRDTQSAIADPATSPTCPASRPSCSPPSPACSRTRAAARPALGEVRAELAKIARGRGPGRPGRRRPAPGGGHLPGTARRPRAARAPCPRRSACRMPEDDPRVPSALVKEAAERLRRDYAASAPF